MMEKKEYIAPEIVSVEVEPSSMIAGSTVDLGTSDDKINSGDALSNRRRGVWGNLWYKE